MALILPYGDTRPRIGRDVFIAPNATIVGDVEIAEEASVWFGAVLRGDVGPIRVGPRTNVQDLVCMHMTGGVSMTDIGADVTIGHGAILHGCKIGDRCLIGMGAVVMDNADIGEGSLVAAGSVVSPRSVFPPRSLIRGTPARLVREVNEQEATLGIDGAGHYTEMGRRYRAICGDLPEGLSLPASFQPAPPNSLQRWEREREPVGRRERALDFGNDRDGGED